MNNLEERIERIVNNEILTCQSSLVEKLLSENIVNYDDIVNLYKDNSEEIEELQEKLEELENQDNEEENEVEIDNLQSKIEELESEQEEPQDIFEWWVVTNWMADKLEEIGEPILRSDYETWWGRTCTGQSIKMDYSIRLMVESLI